MPIDLPAALQPVPRRARDEEVTLDRLAGDWWIFQLRRGHRYASDDVLTAWLGVETLPNATSILDLGAGVGAVGLLALLRLGEGARLTAVEVQSASVGLLRETLRHNGLRHRVSIRSGDLRAPAIFAAEERFALILANPPYLPAHRASRSPHPQRAAARLELHGDVFDYCRVAARRLAPGGRFCFCHRPDDPRCEEAVRGAGLSVTHRRDVVFREGRPPALALFTCAIGEELPRQEDLPLTLRDRRGQRPESYRAVRRAMLIEE
jgi:tRNA1(Val) A37 N6-methylase TrmN6